MHSQKEVSDSKTKKQATNIDNPDTQLGGNKTTKKVVDSIDPNVSSRLLNQYNQFAHQLGLQNNPKEKEIEDQDVEIIPEHPTNEIILKVEEIPPLDIFYNPKHKYVVRKQRKRRRIDQDPSSTSQGEFMNIV